MIQFKIFNQLEDEARMKSIFNLFKDEKNDTIVVVATTADRQRYKDEFFISDSDILRFFTVEDLKSGYVNFHMYGPKYIIIDRIDLILNDYLKIPDLNYLVTFVGVQ